MEWRNVVWGYDSVVCGSIGADIGIKYFSLVHAYRIILYLDCDFVGVRMVTFLFGMGVEWLGEKHEYFVLNVRCSG